MDSVCQNKGGWLCWPFLIGLAIPLFGEKGWLTVKTPLPGFAVFWEDSLIGHTPLDSASLGCGTGLVRVLDPQSRRWLRPEYRTQATIRPRSETLIMASGPNGFWVESMPSHAEILRDGDPIGHTPYFVMDTLFQSASLSVRLGNQTIPLVRESTGETIRVVFASTLQGRYRESTPRSPLRSRQVILSAGLSFSLGLAGYLVKNQADWAYRRYRTATHPLSMEHHFKRAHRYDRIAAACYIAGEAALGITVYFAVKGSPP